MMMVMMMMMMMMFTDTSEHIRFFLLFSFSVFPLFNRWFRAVDQADSCSVWTALVEHLV